MKYFTPIFLLIAVIAVALYVAMHMVVGTID